MEAIQEIIELVLWTAYIKYERIVSLLIVAEPESGKTELMKKYRKNNGIYATKRFSAYGIETDLIEGRMNLLFDKPKILGHIIIYDFSMLFSFKPNTIDSTMAFLDAFTEEGLSPESTYAISYEKLEPFDGLKGGIIGGFNMEGFFTRGGSKLKRTIRQNIKKGGFFSRNLIVSYAISSAQLRMIFDSIVHGEYRTDEKYVNLIALNFPDHRINVSISEEYTRVLVDLSNDILEELYKDIGYKLKGIRLTKILIALAKANALRNKRTSVKREDIERISMLSRWMNLKFEKLKMGAF